jgi:hypothetical protein
VKVLRLVSCHREELEKSDQSHLVIDSIKSIIAVGIDHLFRFEWHVGVDLALDPYDESEASWATMSTERVVDKLMTYLYARACNWSAGRP